MAEVSLLSLAWVCWLHVAFTYPPVPFPAAHRPGPAAWLRAPPEPPPGEGRSDVWASQGHLHVADDLRRGMVAPQGERACSSFQAHAGPSRSRSHCAPASNGRLRPWRDRHCGQERAFGTGEPGHPQRGDTPDRARLANHGNRPRRAGSAIRHRVGGAAGNSRWKGRAGGVPWRQMAWRQTAAMLGIIIGTQQRADRSGPIRPPTWAWVSINQQPPHAEPMRHAHRSGPRLFDRQDPLGHRLAWQPPRRTGRSNSRALASCASILLPLDSKVP